jgi:phosphatidylserine/phosphatidylglycerophosphate/cardiolipin synthase-like enzyme
MRSAIIKSPKGLSVRGIAGTYVVLLAFNCTKAYRKGLLGFAVQRKDLENGEVIWLRGLKKFDLPAGDAGDDVTTRHHPIQKFHWGDYTTKPGRSYTYTVQAMKGKPGALTVFEALELTVTCELPEKVGAHGHAVHFNRSAAASQAFVRRFPSLPAGDVVDPAARTWLSRGLAESLTAFIDATQAGEGLHLFFYEFSKTEYLQALKNALGRGVQLQIVYDAIVKRGKGPSVASAPLIKKFGLKGVARGRKASGINISHNKFMVRTNTQGKPAAVWTGSTNFTDSGVYAQTNVGHAVADAALAKQYFDWHQAIWKNPGTAVGPSRALTAQLSKLSEGAPQGSTLVLSPRKSVEAVQKCAELVAGAQRMVCFTAPFAVHPKLQSALAGTSAQVFGLLNKTSVVGKALVAAPQAQLAAAGALSDSSVLEKWQGRMVKESLQHSGVYIHSKIILIDPLSKNPLVITGSANFSNNSSVNNDENQLFIAGETEVADVYLGEFMRMFDHYYFRDHMKWVAAQKDKDSKVGFLAETDAWTDRYFEDPARVNLRLAFFE